LKIVEVRNNLEIEPAGKLLKFLRVASAIALRGPHRFCSGHASRGAIALLTAAGGRPNLSAALLADIVVNMKAATAYVEFVSARPGEGAVGLPILPTGRDDTPRSDPCVEIAFINADRASAELYDGRTFADRDQPFKVTDRASNLPSRLLH
jgi:hypothetical protein